MNLCCVVDEGIFVRSVASVVTLITENIVNIACKKNYVDSGAISWICFNRKLRFGEIRKQRRHLHRQEYR